MIVYLRARKVFFFVKKWPWKWNAFTEFQCILHSRCRCNVNYISELLTFLHWKPNLLLNGSVPVQNSQPENFSVSPRESHSKIIQSMIKGKKRSRKSLVNNESRKLKFTSRSKLAETGGEQNFIGTTLIIDEFPIDIPFLTSRLQMTQGSLFWSCGLFNGPVHRTIQCSFNYCYGLYCFF